MGLFFRDKLALLDVTGTLDLLDHLDCKDKEYAPAIFTAPVVLLCFFLLFPLSECHLRDRRETRDFLALLDRKGSRENLDNQ